MFEAANTTNLVTGHSGTTTTTAGHWDVTLVGRDSNNTVITSTGNVGGCINPSTRLTISGNHSNGIGAVGTTVTPGLTLSGNSTINYSHSNLISNNMRPTQAKVAVFTITRDSDTNEINSTKFVKELWVEQKNGASIDLIVAKHLDKDFDPETTVIKVLSTVSF